MAKINFGGTKEGVFESLVAYCALPGLQTEDQQFCYNIDSFKGELKRLVLLGADDRRVCNKVRAINSHFCGVVDEGLIADRVDTKKFSQSKRGIIYI